MKSNRLKKGEVPPLTGTHTVCKICNERKDDALFKWQKGKRAGLVCRACDLEKKRNLYSNCENYRQSAITRAKAQKNNPEAAKAYRNRPEIKEKIKARRKTYHIENRERINNKTKQWVNANKERHANRSKAYYKQNVEYFQKIARDYYFANKEKHSEQGKKWRRDNKKKQTAYYRAYNLAKAKRVPIWSETDEIREFYANRPEGYEVDHIIPLFGKLVCGLHVLRNLQYLTESENSSKSNKFDPMDYEDD